MSQSNLSEAIEKILSDEGDVREATASHQKEFPYEREEEAQVTRREFCNFLAVTSTALFLSAAGFTGKSLYDSTKTETFSPLKIENANNLQIGSALNFRYPNENDTAILIRAADGEFYAYGQKCTHLSCPVYYAKESNRIECPCHEAGFDVKTGDVLYGPPPRPLDQIVVEIRNEEVWAVGRIVGRHES